MTIDERSQDATVVERHETVLVERDDGITWVTLNRPEKRNAMNPSMHYEMVDIIADLETDTRTKVVVLTGAGSSWCAGQDLKEFFRDLEGNPVEQRRAGWAAQEWRWRRLWTFPKPTIAMVNGYCFGGAFTQLVACDFAIADEEATFGLSEINWGIFPGGLVNRVLADAMAYRPAMYYLMTGEPFDGRQAAAMNLVTKAVPKAQLREETVKLARALLGKNPAALRAAKESFKQCMTMDYSQAEDYLAAKYLALMTVDPERGRVEGIKQFVEDKSYRPGLQTYKRGG